MIGSPRQDSPGRRRETADKTLQFRGNKKPYMFASQPQALSIREQMNRENMCKQLGYTNIMYDKRVIRGSNFSKKTFSIKESPAARKAEAHRRAVARKKAIDQQTRALRLHLGTSKMSKPRQLVQTDTYLEELYENPQSQTFGAQTEFDDAMFENSVTEMHSGMDASTQVDEMELFDFDTEVTPIIETLIADVFRQALNEMLYEDELAARARQQRTLYFKHTTEEVERLRLEREDERISKIVADHTQLLNDSKKNEKAQISQLQSNPGIDFLPRVPQDSKQNGSTDNIAQAENLEFVSWLMKELQVEKTKNTKIEDPLKNTQSTNHEHSS